MTTYQKNEHTLTHINDAELIGDFHTPEVRALLAKQYDTLRGAYSRQGDWRQVNTTLREIVSGRISKHTTSISKDGPAVIFSRGTPTGRFEEIDGIRYPLSKRGKSDIQAITFAGYDIDDGDALELAVKRLSKLGLFSLLYTTYRHGEPRGEFNDGQVQKYRILFPLAAPFQLAPDDSRRHQELCAEWRERLINFAVTTLDLVIDETGCDVPRMFFMPRHKPGDDNWYSAIFAGRALNVDEMPYSPSTRRMFERRGRRSHGDLSKVKTGPRPILSDGFDLVDWYRDWGPSFLVRDFLDDLQWDIGHRNDSRLEARILCPNDDAHSSSDDIDACWVKDGDGLTPFVIYCHHDACREVGKLEQLVALEQSVALPDGYEHFSELLCDPCFYNSYMNHDDGEWPARSLYIRWDPRDEASVESDGAALEVDQ